MTPSRARPILLTGLFLLTLPLPTSGQDSSPLRVPLGPAITLDGRLGESEWEGAIHLPLSPRGALFLKNHQGFLAVGVRGPSFGLAHLALASRDTIRVLHASAALGSIVYVREGQDWRKIQDPTWEVRDTSQTAAGVAERERYLAAHDWVGTTGYMGRENEIEFLVRRERFGGEELRMAVVFYPMGPPGDLPRWPDTVQDGAVAVELLSGPMPSRLIFEPESWGWIRGP